MMEIKFQNLGALKSGAVEVADLTIICGENNTGNTYVTYLVYCLLKNWKQCIDIDLTSVFSELQRNGVATFDVFTQPRFIQA